MEGLNRVSLVGNLGGDPELKTTASGQSMLKFNIATSESYRDKENKVVDRTEWHRIVVFGKQAEGLAKFVRKGWRVYVEGRLEHSSYEKEGQKHYSTDVVGLRVLVLASPRDRSEDGASRGSLSLGMSNGASAGHGVAAPSVEIPF